MQEITDWFTRKIPEDWFTRPPHVTVDRDEIVVVGELSEGEDAAQFRELTRGERTTMFTHLALPMMTRLRQRERMVLDTLVAAGVARSRADALAWCVRLVGTNEEAWLGRINDALIEVDRARRSGPDAPGSQPPDPNSDA